MRFPCKDYKYCENYEQDSCQGCGELNKHPEWVIECGERVAKLMIVVGKQ